MSGLELKLARVGRRIKQIDVLRTTGITPSHLSLIEKEYGNARRRAYNQLRCSQ